MEESGIEANLGPATELGTTTLNVENRKRRRVSKACESCRMCCEDTIVCVYDVLDGRKTRAKTRQPNSPRQSTTNTAVSVGIELEKASTSNSSSSSTKAVYDSGDHYVGAASGLSFLQQAVQHIESQKGSNDAVGSAVDVEYASPASASIFNSGDMPSLSRPTDRFVMPSKDESDRMLARYFEFATPTYRFFHRPTVESWACQLCLRPDTSNYKQKESRLEGVRVAAVYLVWAQAIEYEDMTQRGSKSSAPYFEKAVSILETEPGPPQLESVQARLAMCLYLLSTFRINECWYRFGMTTLIIMAMGLHRKTETSRKVGLVEQECRKRAFWSSYILDRYLSVMKGRPRIFRDEDIDQEYPVNVDDDDMVFTDKDLIAVLPLRGLLDASINHAKLSTIMGNATDMLYPLRPLTREELQTKAGLVTKLLDDWEQGLPQFLRPTHRTFTGKRMFERQNSVLKLSHAHIRILINRQFLLSNFSTLGQVDRPDDDDLEHQKYVRDCISAAYVIIDTVEGFVDDGNLIKGFWFTQYIALCAISTLYIYIIHHRLNPNSLVSPSGKSYFAAAGKCRNYIENLAPEGSHSKRYNTLLTRLRNRAMRSMGDAVVDAEGDRIGYNATEVSGLLPHNHSIEPVYNGNFYGEGGNNERGVGMEAGFETGGQEVGIQIPEYPDSGSGLIMENDTLQLTWGYLDQLGLPEHFDAFSTQYEEDYF
ncbi:hypothetical protein V501_04551 [Pseudogymnoascus sp. VKM F-4519 (FW-2642)]|nr:hypothetical protein V501_04551 [Pseudogymnoascus sp. VKM F-4519 (FW-2642)]